MNDFRGPSQDYVLSELDRRKGELRTQLVWIGAQKEPGYTSRVWKWVNGKYNLLQHLHKQLNSLHLTLSILLVGFH